MGQILALRALVNRQLESCRKQGGKGSNQTSGEGIGASLEAHVHLEIGELPGTAPLQQALAWLATSTHPEVDNLADWLLVSSLTIGGDVPTAVLAETRENDIAVSISRADGKKCERCWHYEDDIGADPDHPTLCGRCVGVLR